LSANECDSLAKIAYRDIDDQDGNVTQGASSRSQVGKGLVPRGIDDEETGDLELEGVVLEEIHG
jgi:hypothetical protein